MSRYLIGNQIRCTATFTNTDGIKTDPTSVVFTIKDPAGISTTPSVVKEETGVYHSDVTPTISGIWRYRWASTGILIVAAESDLIILSSSII